MDLGSHRKSTNWSKSPTSSAKNFATIEISQPKHNTTLFQHPAKTATNRHEVHPDDLSTLQTDPNSHYLTQSQRPPQSH